MVDPLASILTQPHASIQSHLASIKGGAENISNALDSMIPNISIGKTVSVQTARLHPLLQSLLSPLLFTA